MAGDNILTTILVRKQGFSKSESEIADFVIANPEQCALMSIQELARAVNISEASIVRFAKTLGLRGFQEFKGLLKERLSQSFVMSSRIQSLVEINGSEVWSFIESFINVQQSYIAQIAALEKTPEFKNFCKRIAGASSVFLFEDGGASRAPGDTLEFWLTRFGCHVKRVQSSGHRIFDLIVNHKPGDIFVGFCFGKSNSDLSKLLEYCNGNSIPAILMTDYPDEHIAVLAADSIVVQRGPLEVFHSMSAPVLVSECIALFVAKEKGDIAFSKIKELDDLRKTYHV
jgi:DNA-binding MurR/RpiR family transcriptional regulator